MGLLLALLYLSVRLLWVVHPLVFALFLGVLFGLEVAAGATWLRRLGISQAIGASIVVTGFLALLVGFGLWMAPALKEQSRELRARMPEAVDKIDVWLGGRANGLLSVFLDDAPAADSTDVAARARTAVPHPDSLDVRVPGDSVRAERAATGTRLRHRMLGRLRGTGRSWFPVLSSTAAVVGGFFLVLFIAAYIGAEPETYRRGVLRLVPEPSRARAERTLAAIGLALRRWLVMQLIAMLIIGAVTTAFLFLLRVPAALPLGILAGLLKFIPTIGSVIAAVPAVAMAFIDSPNKALVVAVGYTLIQFLENHIVIPILMQRGVKLPPALTLAAQAVMALLFGFLGLLVAVPLLATVVVLVDKLYAERIGADHA